MIETSSMLSVEKMYLRAIDHNFCKVRSFFFRLFVINVNKMNFVAISGKFTELFRPSKCYAQKQDIIKTDPVYEP